MRIVAADLGLREAAERLQCGALVAFPTETVYGLGANALSPEAVGRIFTTKGRPATNPLIVHVADQEAARKVTSRWSETAQQLANAFWPGPLTLVLPRAVAIPDVVTAGGDTVGVRIPAHPVARQLLTIAAVPVAAPSANRSEEISPTTAQHVADSLGSYAPDLLILDGGPCAVGIESTVVDVSGETVHVLRPGAITAVQIAALLGQEVVSEVTPNAGPVRSPGQMARHYAPRKPLLLVDLATHVLLPGDTVLVLPSDPVQAAERLYAELRRLDADSRTTRIILQMVPTSPEWAAIRDRLQRAAVR